MEFSTVGIPIPVARSAVAPGDIFTINYNGMAAFGLRVQEGLDDFALILSGGEAFGHTEPRLLRMNALPDDIATYPGPFRIYPLPEPKALANREYPNGGLWLDRTGAAFVRINRHGGVTYFSLSDGLDGTPGPGRHTVSSWQVQLDTRSDLIPLFSVNVA
jgi:hypothetical protein